MDFFITLANYLMYSFQGYKWGTLCTALYLLTVCGLFYLPGKALDEKIFRGDEATGASSFFFRVVLGLVFYLGFTGFMTTTFISPHIWVEYQWAILIGVNLFAVLSGSTRSAIGGIKRLADALCFEKGRLICFCIVLCFGTILLHSLWRPFPGDVDSQRIGYLTQMIVHGEAFPALKPIPNLDITYNVLYPPSHVVFLGLFVKMGLPMEYLLRALVGGNLLLCLLIFYSFAKSVLQRHISALLAVIFAVSHVFFYVFAYGTQVPETFGELAFILFGMIFVARGEKLQDTMDLRSSVLLGVVLGTMLLIHGSFFRWTCLSVMICFILQALNNLRFGYELQKTRNMFLNFGIIATVSLVLSGPYLLTIWELGLQSTGQVGFYLLQAFVPAIRTFNGFSYIRFFLFIMGAMLIGRDVFRHRGDEIGKIFVLSNVLMSVFLGGDNYGSYGNAFILPLFIAFGFVWLVEKLKLGEYLKRPAVVIVIMVVYLLYNSWPLYSGLMTPSKGDWDDVQAMKFIASNTRYEGTLILNSSQHGAKWVTPISGRNSIFARLSPANTAKPHREVLSKLSKIHSDPREDDFAFLKKVGVTHVIVLGSIYSFGSRDILSVKKGSTLQAQTTEDALKTSAKWMRIPWVRLVKKFDSLKDGEPTFLFALKRESLDQPVSSALSKHPCYVGGDQ